MRRRAKSVAAKAATSAIFCTLGGLSACTTPSPAPSAPAPAAPPAVVVPTATPPVVESPPPPPIDAREVLPESEPVQTLQPTSEPRYAAPASLQQFRFPQKNQPGVVLAKNAPKTVPVKPAAPVGEPAPVAVVDVAAPAVATVNAADEAPRYKLPESLSHWRGGRKVPLYEDPEAAPWQATATEPRLRNAAVSCNYKDEGGVRGRVTLLVDDHRVTRFAARIEMPNGGVCQFDSKKMEQRPFEQGIALQAKGDECVVRMWEQKHRITIAAYSCHKQCSKGSFSYLWPILMDTRIGTCY